MTEAVFSCFYQATTQTFQCLTQLPKAAPFSIFVLLEGFMVMKSKTLQLYNTNTFWKEAGKSFSIFCPWVLSRDAMWCTTSRTLCGYDKNVLSSLDSVFPDYRSCYISLSISLSVCLFVSIHSLRHMRNEALPTVWEEAERSVCQTDRLSVAVSEYVRLKCWDIAPL